MNAIMRRQRFVEAGIQAMLPSLDWARLCLDKLACEIFLRAAGFEASRASKSLTESADALAQGELNFPLVIKARLGYGSLALEVCDDWVQLTSAYRKATVHLADSPEQAVCPLPHNERVLIQPLVAGREYKLAFLHNLLEEYMAHYIGEEHKMRFGESESFTTCDPDLLDDLPHFLHGRWGRKPSLLGRDWRVGCGG